MSLPYTVLYKSVRCRTAVMFCCCGSTQSQAAVAQIFIEFPSGLSGFTMLSCLLCPNFSAGVKIEFSSWINELFVYVFRGGKEKWISLMNVFARHVKIKAWDQKQQLCSENKPINSSFLLRCNFVWCFFFFNLYYAND